MPDRGGENERNVGAEGKRTTFVNELKVARILPKGE